MKTYRYVKLDPTGNITCLVLDPADNGDEKTLTRELLKECEQVAYLEKPSLPGTVAAIRLMGGEFCGNAAMAAGAWLVRDELAEGSEMSFLMQVSGAPEPVNCRIRRLPECFEGTVEMPPVKEIREENIGGVPFTLVRMNGIVHLIRDGDVLEKEDAEKLLKQAAAGFEDDAVGLLQWNRDTQYMRPLVYVRGSESLVWENGCGSGSAAVGAAEALRAGNGERVTQVKQPGGVICVRADAEDGRIVSVEITGKVRLDTERNIEIP